MNAIKFQFVESPDYYKGPWYTRWTKWSQVVKNAEVPCHGYEACVSTAKAVKNRYSCTGYSCWACGGFVKKEK